MEARNYTKKLSGQQYKAVSILLEKIPDELFTETNLVLGAPDAADGGGYYIETDYKGQKRFWYIDKDLNNVPAKLHPFLEQVQAKITYLQ